MSNIDAIKIYIFFTKGNRNDIHCTKTCDNNEAAKYAKKNNLDYEPIIPEDPAIKFEFKQV